MRSPLDGRLSTGNRMVADFRTGRRVDVPRPHSLILAAQCRPVGQDDGFGGLGGRFGFETAEGRGAAPSTGGNRIGWPDSTGSAAGT